MKQDARELSRPLRQYLINAKPFDVLAGQCAVTLDDVEEPSYGHFLEDFTPGTIFEHPRGLTLHPGLLLDYATTFMEANPLYLNEEFARSQGYESLPAAPHLLLNLALSLGVQNDSEKALANLGYFDVRFPRPAYAGDTLTGLSRVFARRDRGPGKPGIVTLETLAQNQAGRVVVQYRRRIMVPRCGDGAIDERARVHSPRHFPYEISPVLSIPWRQPEDRPALPGLTTSRTLLGAFRPGQILLHSNGRTITDEHLAWTNRLLNSHPLHFDRLYAAGQEGPLSGEPVVYGGLVFAWLLGLASRDVSENALWDLGYHDGYHTQPSISGFTVFAVSRVLAIEPMDAVAGVLRLQLIGLKNLRGRDALDRYGAGLFEPEHQKREVGAARIPEKIFEIERSLLVRHALP